MGVVEHRITDRIRKDDSTSTSGEIRNIALVPRNTRATLKKVRISIIIENAITLESVILAGVIPWKAESNSFFAGQASEDQILSLKWICSVLLGGIIGGTPVNQATLKPFVNIEFDFDRENPFRGLKIVSKGPQSNNQAGWSFMAITLDGSADIISWMTTLEYDMEWLGGSGSKRPMDILELDSENQ